MKIIKENLGFGTAFEIMKNNKLQMRLPHWEDDDAVIGVQYPKEYEEGTSDATIPYLYFYSMYGRVPWVGSAEELFSEEWQVVEWEEDESID